MIRRLRRRHRWTMLALALMVPALFAAGLLARRPMPRVALPEVLSSPGPAPEETLFTQLENTGTGLVLRIVTLAPVPGSDRKRLWVQSTSDPKRPELLVYWNAGPGAATAIDDDSYLLGALIGAEPASFRLPERASEEPGGLTFFSLAQQEIVDSVALRSPAPEQNGP